MGTSTRLSSIASNEAEYQQLLEQLTHIEQQLGLQQVLEFNFFCKTNFVSIDLRFVQPEDWFTVSLLEARELGLPKSKVKSLAQLVRLLQEKYPEHNWDKMFIMKGRFGQQRRLQQAVSSLFPVRIPLSTPPRSQKANLSFFPQGLKMIVNAREEAGIINPATGHFLELDIFFPSLNMAFEYQVHISSSTLVAHNRLSKLIFSGETSFHQTHHI